MEQQKVNSMAATANAMKEAQANADNTASEELKNDPGYKLFDHIYQTSTRLFDEEETKKVFAEVEVKLGKDAALSLMSFMVIAMTNSAYEAVAYYHNTMLDIMNEQFTAIIDHISGVNADMEGMKAAISVIRKQNEDLKTQLANDKIIPK